MSHNFLLVSWGTSGNLNPLLTAGRQLRRCGHRVRVMDRLGSLSLTSFCLCVTRSQSPNRRRGGGRMRELRCIAVGTLVVLVASGCALRERKWGSCAVDRQGRPAASTAEREGYPPTRGRVLFR